MLESLMATHYNGQVLMMEKSKFDFDFLSTILEHLQQARPREGRADGEEQGPALAALLQDLARPGAAAGVRQLLGEAMDAQVEVVRGIQADPAAPTDLDQRRAVQGLRNALFLWRNNIAVADRPLTNIALEVAKFSCLVKFISKDAGIKTAISQRFGEVALKELEALVLAHEDRGDTFVTKFVDKNVALYHGLRLVAVVGAKASTGSLLFTGCWLLSGGCCGGSSVAC